MTLLIPFATRHLSSRYVSWLNNPEVVRYSEQRHRIHTLESCRAFVSRFGSGPDRLWAIEVGGIHVGNITAIVNVPNGTAEINILIGESGKWCSGIGTESCREAINAMLDAGYRKIWMETLSCNLPMLRVMNKIGLVADGVTRRHFVVDGLEVDAIRMAVFAPNRV